MCRVFGDVGRKKSGRETYANMAFFLSTEDQRAQAPTSKSKGRCMGFKTPIPDWLR